jgi:hypothetical protein
MLLSDDLMVVARVLGRIGEEHLVVPAQREELVETLRDLADGLRRAAIAVAVLERIAAGREVRR